MEKFEDDIIERGDGIMMIAPAKLKHGAFWIRMDRATKQVDRWPTWVKGSPRNQGDETVSAKPKRVNTAELSTFLR